MVTTLASRVIHKRAHYRVAIAEPAGEGFGNRVGEERLQVVERGDLELFRPAFDHLSGRR